VYQGPSFPPCSIEPPLLWISPHRFYLLPRNFLCFFDLGWYCARKRRRCPSSCSSSTLCSFRSLDPIQTRQLFVGPCLHSFEPTHDLHLFRKFGPVFSLFRAASFCLLPRLIRRRALPPQEAASSADIEVYSLPPLFVKISRRLIPSRQFLIVATGYGCLVKFPASPERWLCPPGEKGFAR